MKNFGGAGSKWWAESAPLGWNRVKVSENLGATAVAPVALVDTCLVLHANKELVEWWLFVVTNHLNLRIITHKS